MSWFTPTERRFAHQVADLVLTNPFHADWLRKQHELIGPDPGDPIEAYSWRPGHGLWGSQEGQKNLFRLAQDMKALVEQGCQRWRDGTNASDEERMVYQILATYVLYQEHGKALDDYIDTRVQAAGGPERRNAGPAGPLSQLWDRFEANHRQYFGDAEAAWPLPYPAHHLFACFFVLRRAFYFIFFNIIGSSPPVARLRSAVWQSIVTHDLRHWSTVVHARMKDTPTLITGPSGTGKELVAQAIGRSGYVAFHPRTRSFAGDFLTGFQPVNLSALPPTLIESEMFGHVVGAFTGAVKERQGRLASCPDHGAVFLDEIGELTGELQVKLLRVLQERRFQRVGESDEQRFVGKMIAATNRDLAEEIAQRRFREDLYYRLCADRIHTPSLHEQLTSRPEDLPLMVEHIARRVIGGETVATFAQEVASWIERHLGRHHPWPGNFRELEQCVRSYVLRREYHPLRRADATEHACRALAEVVTSGRQTYQTIERRLFALVHASAGSWQEAGRLLDRDWRTVKRIVEPDTDRSGRPSAAPSSER